MRTCTRIYTVDFKTISTTSQALPCLRPWPKQPECLKKFQASGFHGAQQRRLTARDMIDVRSVYAQEFGNSQVLIPDRRAGSIIIRSRAAIQQQASQVIVFV